MPIKPPCATNKMMGELGDLHWSEDNENWAVLGKNIKYALF